ncbi:MAG: hypothetical protein IAE89_11265 [Anaerolineae bacterium]|nr:hypothetical protein [Anaerolineae bacterium]
MDILLVLLRLLHIIAAFVWIALGLTQVLFVGPAVGKSGESGLRFLKALLTKTAFPMAFPIAAGLTVLAGILLYFVSNSASHFSTTGNIVLGIGAASGLLAAGHGGAVTGRITGDMAKALVQYVPDDHSPISAEGLQALRGYAMKLASHGRISLVLMIVALVGMGAARYL